MTADLRFCAPSASPSTTTRSDNGGEKLDSEDRKRLDCWNGGRYLTGIALFRFSSGLQLRHWFESRSVRYRYSSDSLSILSKWYVDLSYVPISVRTKKNVWSGIANANCASRNLLGDAFLCGGYLKEGRTIGLLQGKIVHYSCPSWCSNFSLSYPFASQSLREPCLH